MSKAVHRLPAGSIPDKLEGAGQPVRNGPKVNAELDGAMVREGARQVKSFQGVAAG